MPYRRRYRRTRSNPDKYSVEQRAGLLSVLSTGDASVVVVPSSSIGGMRKVKHLTISVAGPYAQNSPGSVLYYALVYVPQGYTVNTLSTDGQSLYEPNQFVMSSGVLNIGSGPNRIYSPISRNLNSGDNIVLVVKSAAADASYSYVVKYAITLQ